MRCNILFAVVLSLATNQSFAQQDVLYRGTRGGINVWELLPDRNLSIRAFLSPSLPSEDRFWYLLAIDPRTNELWGVQEDGVNPASFCRLQVQGTQYSIAEEYPLPRHTSVIVAGNFDDDGNWVICASAGYTATLDLLQRRVVRTTNLAREVGFVLAFSPARRGAPAVVCGFDFGTGIPQVAEIDANGQITRTYVRNTTPWLPLISTFTTTEDGRIFGCGTTSVLRGFYEFDYARGVMITHEDRSPYGGTSCVLEDASRGILQIWYHQGFSLYSRGIFDLRTNRIVNQLDDRGTIYVDWLGSHVAWFPRDRLIVSPLNPAAGTSFEAVLSVGGDPGEAGLLWFDRATIGGVNYPNLSTIVSTGLIDSRGVFRTALSYRPAILPLQAGDALYFRGFNWNGTELITTPEVALRWR